MMRFLVNVATYAVFGGGLFAFAALRGGGAVKPLEVALAVSAVALWSGGLTTAIERIVPCLPAASTRVLAGAVLGALSLGGFALVLGLVVWGLPEPRLVALATLAGAVMQAARTFAARPASMSAPNAEGADPVNPRQLIANGALVIDVRNPSEWDQGHLPMARLLPVDELPARVAEVVEWAGGDRARAVVVYCRSGARSGRAQKILMAAGFTKVTNGGSYDDVR